MKEECEYCDGTGRISSNFGPDRDMTCIECGGSGFIEFDYDAEDEDDPDLDPTNY